MLKLPAVLPREIREALEALPTDLDEALLELGAILSRAVKADLGVSSLQLRELSIIKVVSHLPHLPEKFSQTFLYNWQESGIHQQISEDLLRKPSPKTLSSFSWPYSYVQSSEPEKEVYQLPKDFCLLTPLSSALIVSTERDPSFEGYVALFFDRMPNIEQELLQMIITLPALLSELVAALLRLKEVESGGVSLFAHEVKRGLLIQREILEWLKKIELDSAGQNALGRLDRCLKRLLLTTNSTLLAEREGLSVSPMTVSINELIEEVVIDMTPLFEAAGITLDVSLDSSLGDSALDPALFPGALSNVLDNALKFSELGDTVRIKSCLGHNSGVRVEVHDNGPGISEEDRKRIFEKRFRGSNAEYVTGSGLGLYLVKQIVVAHGGNVSYQPGENGGSIISFEIPTV